MQLVEQVVAVVVAAAATMVVPQVQGELWMWQMKDRVRGLAGVAGSGLGRGAGVGVEVMMPLVPCRWQGGEVAGVSVMEAQHQHTLQLQQVE